MPGSSSERKGLFFLQKGGGGLGNIQRSVCKLMVSGYSRVAVVERDGNSISRPSWKKPLYTHTHTCTHTKTHSLSYPPLTYPSQSIFIAYAHTHSYAHPWASKEDLHITQTHTNTYTDKHTCTHKRTHAHICVCMRIYSYTRTNTHT